MRILLLKTFQKMEGHEGKNPPYDLRERILIFAKRILEVCKRLPQNPECQRIRSQLGASASSVGANYEESDAAITKKDSRNKLAIARKEAKETRFFLQLLEGTYLNDLQKEVQEAEELIKILSRLIKNTQK